jgi:hypothetical protein
MRATINHPLTLSDLNDPGSEFLNPDRMFREIVAEKIQLASQICISGECLRDARLDLLADHAANQLVLRLSAYVVGLPTERISVHRQWPADWVQAFKERWFPAFLLRRWPVRYERLDVDEPRFGAVCPHLKTADHSAHLRFLVEHRPCMN